MARRCNQVLTPPCLERRSYAFFAVAFEQLIASVRRKLLACLTSAPLHSLRAAAIDARLSHAGMSTAYLNIRRRLHQPERNQHSCKYHSACLLLTRTIHSSN